MSESIYNSLVFLSNQLVTDIVIFMPRFILGFFILIVGAFLVRTFRNVVTQVLKGMSLTKKVEQTPFEHFLKNTESGYEVEDVIAAVLYWLAMLLVIHATVSVWGLASLSLLLGNILSYLPRIISAVFILFFGLFVSGVVESLVKGAIKSVDGKSARLLGKISSYIVLVVTVLATISELGIAKEFIFIMFIGFVVTLSLGFGLAIGLGAKDTVALMLKDWYSKHKMEEE